MGRSVVITGAGVVSSLGDSAAELQRSLCDGRLGLAPIQLFSTEGLACHLGGEIRSFTARRYVGDRNLRPLDRTSQLVISAAQMALDDSGWTPEMRNAFEVGLALGTMFCSVRTISEFDRRALVAGPGYASPMDFANTVINAAAGQTAIWHNLRGANSTIAAGSTSGLQALAYATHLIQAGQSEAILAGGADELCFESFYGFERAELLCGSRDRSGDFPIPLDVRRNGFVLGEGAALLMLEDSEVARRRGATVLARIAGRGISYDSTRGNYQRKSVEAIARAMRLAVNDAGIASEDIEFISLSANGSVRLDRHEAQAVAAFFNGRSQTVPVTAVKAALGETLGAAGALQTVAMVESMRTGVLPGIAGLEQLDPEIPLASASSRSREVKASAAIMNSVGLDGSCCSIVVTRC